MTDPYKVLGVSPNAVSYTHLDVYKRQVYGLAANALNGNAVKRIFEAKGRPQDNPLIVHIASLDTLPKLVASVPDEALALADRFWPGPLTIIPVSYTHLETGNQIL